MGHLKKNFLQVFTSFNVKYLLVASIHERIAEIAILCICCDSINVSCNTVVLYTVGIMKVRTFP